MFTLRQYSDNPVKKEFTNFPFYNEWTFFRCVCVLSMCAEYAPGTRSVYVGASQYFFEASKEKRVE